MLFTKTNGKTKVFSLPLNSIGVPAPAFKVNCNQFFLWILGNMIWGQTCFGAKIIQGKK